MAVAENGERIIALALEVRSLVQALAEAVNETVDAEATGRTAGGRDRQPRRVNELATRAMRCADEIAHLAQPTRPGPT